MPLFPQSSWKLFGVRESRGKITVIMVHIVPYPCYRYKYTLRGKSAPYNNKSEKFELLARAPPKIPVADRKSTQSAVRMCEKWTKPSIWRVKRSPKPINHPPKYVCGTLWLTLHTHNENGIGFGVL